MLRRFGPLSEAVLLALRNVPADRLDDLIDAALSASTLEELNLNADH